MSTGSPPVERVRECLQHRRSMIEVCLPDLTPKNINRGKESPPGSINLHWHHKLGTLGEPFSYARLFVTYNV